MNKFILLLGIALSMQTTYAQNEEDALRYSQTYFGGTARNTGSAGALSAIGGDFSFVSQNPASLARIRKSNFSTTLNIEGLFAKSDFYGNSTKYSGSAGNLSNLSYVKAYELNPKKFNNWYSVQLGMGMTRINSFQERINYAGVADSSILHSFINEANGTPDSLIYDYFPFSAGLAYDVFAIDPAGGNQYSTDFNSGNALHNRTITRKGGMHEYSFSLSGNYANKLYLGGSFNLTRVKYTDAFQHRESYTDTSLWLQSINYTGNLEVEGWGYGLRLGALVLPNDWLSFGVSAQLPTLYRLSDSYTNNMTAETDDGGKFVSPEFVPTGSYDYQIITPFKANVSVGALLSKYGSIGAEVEFVDYSTASLSDRKFSSAPYSFNSENFQIANLYTTALNVKIGFEAKLTSQLYLRGGYARYGSPYREDKGNLTMPTQFYTGGVGYNMGSVYVDFSCVMRQSSSNFYAYDPTINGSKALIDSRNLSFKVSLGLRFDD